LGEDVLSFPRTPLARRIFMFFHELRIALRHLLKSPGFSLTAVLMLAFGIGATTAIFSIVECVLLRPLPFPDSERLVSLGDSIEGVDSGGNGPAGVSGPEVPNYIRDTHAFESLGGVRQTTYELSGIGDPAQVNATRTGANVFSALEIPPLMGRYYTQKEDDQKQQVAVISYSLWQQRLHGDRNVLGTKILLDRKPYEIIGVMPRNFEFPLVPGQMGQSQLWVPLSLTPDEGPGNFGFNLFGRLKPGISTAQAQSDAERVAQINMRSFPAFMSSIPIHAVVHSMHEDIVADSRPLVRTLFFATSVVLLIACANLAGLLLVRAIRRRREIAVRLALGASASTLLRQTMLESLLLSVTGSGIGLLFTVAALRIGMSYLPEDLPRINEIGVNWPVVLFAALLGVFTGAICGLAPAFSGLRTKVNDTLKEGARIGTTGSGHARLRSALVVGEIAIALVLLASCGLLLRSFEKMRQVDLGFRPDHTLVASYSLPQKQYSTQAQANSFNDELLRRLQQLPGVKSVGITTFLPAAGSSNSDTFFVEGYVPPKGANLNLATPMLIQGDYLQAMGIPLLAGRPFNDSDTPDTQLVALVNHKFAQHFWPNGDPLGKHFRIGTAETPTPWITIVGEVADVKEYSPDLPDKEQWYETITQFTKSLGPLAQPSDIGGSSGYIAIRTITEPSQMANALRLAVRSIDPQLPLAQIQTMERTVSDSEATRRFNTALISAFALAAVLLAALGIYSVIAFSAALRVQEMAIRMALGSQRSGILRLVFSSALRLAGTGCAIGLLGAILASHLLRSLLFDISPFDPIVLAGAAAFVLLLAFLASLLPAQRAASINPMNALRAE
jgi:putative ABC transport system permease protein